MKTAHNVKHTRPMVANPFGSLIREAKIFYFAWALAEINPLHPDVPRIVHRLRSLRAERYSQPCALRAIVRWL